MKNLRFLLALAVAGAFAMTAAHAGDKEKSQDKSEKPVCTMDCKPGKDGKFACSKDGGKTCCCGAEAKAEKKDKKDEKAEPKH